MVSLTPRKFILLFDAKCIPIYLQMIHFLDVKREVKVKFFNNSK